MINSSIFDRSWKGVETAVRNIQDQQCHRRSPEDILFIHESVQLILVVDDKIRFVYATDFIQ